MKKISVFGHFRVDELLKGYEFILSEAMTAGINITSEEKEFRINWDYLQSVFFSTTILTTIGIVCQLSIIIRYKKFQVMATLLQLHFGEDYSAFCLL